MGFIIAFIFIALVFLLGSIKNNNSETRPSQGGTSKTLYESKGIRSFEMRGMHYRDLPLNVAGRFSGYVIVEDNSHDKYAVGIYNKKDRLLGYVPRGNKRLHDSLLEWHDGEALAWGYLDYSENGGEISWNGEVHVPVGYDEDEIKHLKEAIRLAEHQDVVLENPTASIQDYLSILSNHRTIELLVEELGLPNTLDYSLSNSVIPRLTKFLEDKKDWETLAEMEVYGDLIEQLPPKFAAAAQKRIDRAKEKLAIADNLA
jgi:hypothetical protein